MSTVETNKIYCGDNLEIMKEFPYECIDLIYLDPPFFSGKTHEVIWEDETRSFEDNHSGGIKNYVQRMVDRFHEMYRILKNTGSLYVHVDWHASHYLKVELDKIFGYENFRNEITWKRTHAHNDPKQFGRNSDKILFYTKSDDYTFNTQYQPYDQSYIDNFFNGKDERGVYRLVVLTGPGVSKGESDTEWKSYKPSQSGRSWSVPKRIVNKLVGEEKAKQLSIKDRLDLLFDNDYIVISKNGIPSFKQYLQEMQGVPLQEIWDDIGPVSSQSKERIGYPTQKPEALLDRVIKTSSNKNDVVLDPYCGCGTTIAVADKLDRKYIGIDISKKACKIIAERVHYQHRDIINLCPTIEDLKAMEPHEFQQWVCNRMYAENTSKNKGLKSTGGDGGKDGIIVSNIFTTGYAGCPLQVKQSESVGINVVKNLFATMSDMKKKIGFIVALSFGSGAVEKVAEYKLDGRADIRLIKAEDLCNIKYYNYNIQRLNTNEA